jgi:hypothetical protein
LGRIEDLIGNQVVVYDSGIALFAIFEFLQSRIKDPDLAITWLWVYCILLCLSASRTDGIHRTAQRI